MSDKLNSLQETRSKLAVDIRALADRQDKWTDEDKASWDKLNAAYDENLANLEKAQAEADNAAKIAARLEAIKAHDNAPAYSRKIGRDGGRLDEELPVSDPWNSEHAGRAIRAWLSRGRYDLSESDMASAKLCGVSPGAESLRIPLASNFSRIQREYRNALSSNDGPTGGFLKSETLISSLERNMLAFGGILQVADVIRTSTAEPMRWPTADDTSNSGRQIGENAVVTSTAQPSFAQVVWNAYKFTSDEILVPFELLRDSVVDLGSVVGAMLGERLGRILATKFTTGSGAATPRGIVTAATLGVTAASATAITWDELIDLEHSVDPAYRNDPSAGYAFHDNVLKALRKLKTGTGEYLWTPGKTGGAPDAINGKPYTVLLEMASSIASSNKTVLYGAFRYYKVRQVNAVRLYRLVERHRENDQDAFLAFVEADGNLLQAGTAPVKYLQQA